MTNQEFQAISILEFYKSTTNARFQECSICQVPYDIAYQEVVAQSLWRFGDVFKFDLLHYIHIERNFY